MSEDLDRIREDLGRLSEDLRRVSEDWDLVSELLSSARLLSPGTLGHFDTISQDNDSARHGLILGARAPRTAFVVLIRGHLQSFSEHETRGTHYPKHAESVGGRAFRVLPTWCDKQFRLTSLIRASQFKGRV